MIYEQINYGKLQLSSTKNGVQCSRIVKDQFGHKSYYSHLFTNKADFMGFISRQYWGKEDLTVELNKKV